MSPYTIRTICFCNCRYHIIYVTFSRCSTMKLLGNRDSVHSEQSHRCSHANDAYDRFDDLRIRSRVVIKRSQHIPQSSDIDRGNCSPVILRHAFVAIEKYTRLALCSRCINRIINIGTRNLTVLRGVTRTHAHTYIHTRPYDGTTFITKTRFLCFRWNAGFRGRSWTGGEKNFRIK